MLKSIFSGSPDAAIAALIASNRSYFCNRSSALLLAPLMLDGFYPMLLRRWGMFRIWLPAAELLLLCVAAPQIGSGFHIWSDWY